MESLGAGNKGPEVLELVELTIGKEMTNSLACPVCFGLFQDPYVLSCGHTFCKSCIFAVGKTASRAGIHPSCPMDREPCKVHNGQVVCNPNFTLKSLLASCSVRCRNAYQKCEGTAAWELRPEHSRCPFQYRLDKFTESETRAHEAECELAWVICECEGCGFYGFRCDLAAHMQAEGAKKTCRLCAAVYHKQERDTHECSKEIVLCPNASKGCLAYVERGSLKEHLDKTCKAMSLVRTMADLEAKMAEVRREQAEMMEHARSSYTIFVKFAHLGSTRTVEVFPRTPLSDIYSFIDRVHGLRHKTVPYFVTQGSRLLTKDEDSGATDLSVARHGILRDSTLVVHVRRAGFTNTRRTSR